jgi:hypothetical protein
MLTNRTTHADPHATCSTPHALSGSTAAPDAQISGPRGRRAAPARSAKKNHKAAASEPIHMRDADSSDSSEYVTPHKRRRRRTTSPTTWRLTWCHTSPATQSRTLRRADDGAVRSSAAARLTMHRPTLTLTLTPTPTPTPTPTLTLTPTPVLAGGLPQPDAGGLPPLDHLQPLVGATRP